MTVTHCSTLDLSLESHDAELMVEWDAGGHSPESTLPQVIPIFFAGQCCYLLCVTIRGGWA